MTQHKTTKYARTSIQLSPLFKDTSLTSFPPHGVCLCFSLSLLVWLFFSFSFWFFFSFHEKKNTLSFLKRQSSQGRKRGRRENGRRSTYGRYISFQRLLCSNMDKPLYSSPSPLCWDWWPSLWLWHWYI